MDRFSRQFQKSTENTTCELFDDICRLAKLYCKNLLTTEYILAAGDNLGLTLLNMNKKEILNSSSVLYVHSFFGNCQKNDFGDPITCMKDLGVLQPDKTAAYSASTVKLGKAFPSDWFI